MAATITTARNGQALRDYAKSKLDNEKIAVFPEAGLSASEQAAFMKSQGGSYDEIVTFSPFIISDAAEGSLRILDDRNHEVQIRHGDSVNKVTLALWHRFTIGEIALDRLNAARCHLEEATTEGEIDEIIDTHAYRIGDSVEKVLFLKSAMDKIASLAK